MVFSSATSLEHIYFFLPSLTFFFFFFFAFDFVHVEQGHVSELVSVYKPSTPAHKKGIRPLFFFALTIQPETLGLHLISG